MYADEKCVDAEYVSDNEGHLKSACRSDLLRELIVLYINIIFEGG